MNEKFWDLKKSKQDSMINGALKVFSYSGFRHASTDEIVTEASVSKGLLFHYFFSKAGLYEFLAEYSARFALVELRSETKKIAPLSFIELQNALTAAESRIMQHYPYLLLFLNRAKEDAAMGIQSDVLSDIALFTDALDALLENTVLPDHMTMEEARSIDHLLRLSRIDAARSVLRQKDGFSPEQYTAEIEGFVKLFENTSVTSVT